MFWYPHWQLRKQTYSKNNQSLVLDPDRRSDTNCFSVCSATESYFQPFSIFFVFFFVPTKWHNSTNHFRMSVPPSGASNENRRLHSANPRLFALSLTLKKLFSIQIIVIQSCNSLLAIRRISVFWVSIYRVFIYVIFVDPSYFIIFSFHCILCRELHTFTLGN